MIPLPILFKEFRNDASNGRPSFRLDAFTSVFAKDSET